MDTDTVKGVIECVLDDAFARAFVNISPQSPDDDQLGEQRLNDLQRQHILSTLFAARAMTQKRLEESMPLTPTQQMSLAAALLESLSEGLQEIDGIIDFGPEFRRILDDIRAEGGLEIQ
jgi:hypothetical protein